MNFIVAAPCPRKSIGRQPVSLIGKMEPTCTETVPEAMLRQRPPERSFPGEIVIRHCHAASLGVVFGAIAP
jgi:hypothetical protein